MPTPLPPNSFPESAFQGAYQRCLSLEAAAPDLEAPSHCPSPVVCARILGHLLRLAPDGNGRGQVQRQITLAVDNTQLMEVAGVYMNGFIRTFKRSGRPTPAPSSHPSRPSFEDVREYNPELMEEAKLDYRTARQAVLYRDNYRCLVTAKAAIHHGGMTYVQATHIIPASTNMNIVDNEKKRFHSAGVWAILSMFTDIDIVTNLAGNKIHRLENILSMSVQCHLLFDDLFLWFKLVEGQPHTYRVHLRFEEWREAENIPEVVTFSTTTDLPLPDDPYLILHALCCEVAWMSGAGEYIMDIERRTDETKVLANDGSTVDLLESALMRVTVL